MQLPSRTTVLGLWLWTIVLCLASQIPYYLVWRGHSTFPYDAFTTFNPWFVGQLAELRAGEGLLGLYQDEVPFDVWPSYFFTGILRQLSSLWQANTAIGHALVQAVHVVLMVPATALLCGSFGVPWRYGVVGGLVFTLAGIHVSLAHHVLAHEALLYLVLSLYCLRETVLGWNRFVAARRAAMFALTGIVTISLVRVHHEAVLYLIPLTAWAIGHLFALRQRSGGGAVVRAAVAISGLGILVALASVPMLVTTYELSLVNKTAINSYEELGPYFSDTRAFFASLVLPGFSGGNAATMPVAFGFHQEATLSYVFFGTLTLPLFVVVLGTWWREGRNVSTAVLAATVVIVLGYTIGAGSPIHRLLCILFPFLIKIGHNYYGLHLLYLLAAFVVAEGMRIVIEQGRYRFLACVAFIQACLVLYLAHKAVQGAGWGLDGSLEAFGKTVANDVRWHVVLMAMLAVLAVVACVRIGGHTILRRVGARFGGERSKGLVLVVLTMMIGADMLRPVATAHFLPNANWVAWGTSPLGGFNPSREIRRFLNAQQLTQQRPLRIVPIFPKGGGWQGNALMATDMHLVGMPGDSGGNRHIEAWLSQGPDAARIMQFIDRFGVDAVWVSRWGVEDWAATLAATPLVKVYSSAYGGDVYMRPDAKAELALANGDGLQLPWRNGNGQPMVEQGIVTRTWRFKLPAFAPGASRQVRLPLMWHAGYGIKIGSESVPFQSSADGTVLITMPAQAAAQSSELVVRYPNMPIAVLMMLAASIYVGLLVMLAWACWMMFRKPMPSRLLPEPAFRRVPER